MEELITEKDIIMRGGAAAAAAPDYKIKTGDNQNLDEQLFQILENGVNAMVEQIKEKLGDDIPKTNNNARKIIDILDKLITSINGDINQLSTVDHDVPRITLDKSTGKYKTNRDQHYINLSNTNKTEYNLHDFFENGKYQKDGWGLATKKITMENLNSNITIHNPTPVIQETTNDVATIERRLNNCQFLEILYLVKHEELMKTFAFTLNLFDKYKYSIKVLLFVLKNLVKKQTPTTPTTPGGPGTAPIVKLPKTLIPNITKLLEDQKKVQEVITTMQDTLNENSPLYATTPKEKDAITKLSQLSTPSTINLNGGGGTSVPLEILINKNVQNVDSPPNRYDINKDKLTFNLEKGIKIYNEKTKYNAAIKKIKDYINKHEYDLYKDENFINGINITNNISRDEFTHINNIWEDIFGSKLENLTLEEISKAISIDNNNEFNNNT